MNSNYGFVLLHRMKLLQKQYKYAARRALKLCWPDNSVGYIRQEAQKSEPDASKYIEIAVN